MCNFGRFRNMKNQRGRSMIEMLGVLAIIGVLSVGGIAGYSKAMEHFKLNKAISEYSYLIYGLLEHLTDLRNVSKNGTAGRQYGLTDIVEAANLVPKTWIRDNNADFHDPNGNYIRVFSADGRVVIDMYLGSFQVVENKSASTAFSPKLCSRIMQDIVQPLASVLYVAWFTNDSGKYYYRGESYCFANQKCIRDLTLQEINSACKSCTKEAGKVCGLILAF